MRLNLTPNLLVNFWYFASKFLKQTGFYLFLSNALGIKTNYYLTTIMVRKKLRAVCVEIESNEISKEEESQLEFLDDVLRAIFKSYNSKINNDKFEDVFNQLFVWPYLEAIANDINIESAKANFESGQPRLESMTQQLKANDVFINDKSCYKTDGLIKLFWSQEARDIIAQEKHQISMHQKCTLHGRNQINAFPSREAYPISRAKKKFCLLLSRIMVSALYFLNDEEVNICSPKINVGQILSTASSIASSIASQTISLLKFDSLIASL
ncbi:MAG: hypothetical protein EXX96DRAFT_540891 [Benjaminiella poitrasii]|nr:MAG: hypothetical protein EXX96DRAFT_540891 [Benjaminiella poitrasii]